MRNIERETERCGSPYVHRITSESILGIHGSIASDFPNTLNF